MLATAIAEVLTLRPRVPVAFLASHFQGLVTNKSAAGISCLRSCHPSSPAFPSAVEKVFHDLAAIEAAPTTILSTSSSTDSLQRSSSAAQQGPNPSRKVKAGGPTTISEASFLQLLQQLSTDFPKPLQTRVLETALSVAPSASTKETPSSRGVGLARFQRGVQACLLAEELMDAATLLFQALELKNSASPGAVTSDTLMNALRSAATSQFPRELTAALAPLLARSAAPHNTLTSRESAPMESPAPTNRHLLQLNDVCDLLFDLVVVP
ncbi:hypothetical protein PHYPSEUDO_003681 [Phytophthora pseudosyringae]|uniref:Uncharacterized protein n=1 Tax=Phytophthora pseudosyringae TaxID=221518 RepID=A0A8T1VQP4_9STRA|nr:hypothetical protein PHYPSEUDO_003681 [Phytophthora pseudosyringae]